MKIKSLDQTKISEGTIRELTEEEMRSRLMMVPPDPVKRITEILAQANGMITFMEVKQNAVMQKHSKAISGVLNIQMSGYVPNAYYIDVQQLCSLSDEELLALRDRLKGDESTELLDWM